jgi:hypothetical protein
MEKQQIQQLVRLYEGIALVNRPKYDESESFFVTTTNSAPVAEKNSPQITTYRFPLRLCRIELRRSSF